MTGIPFTKTDPCLISGLLNPDIAKVLMAADTFVFGIFMYLNDLTYPLQFQIDWDLLKNKNIDQEPGSHVQIFHHPNLGF